ncbi:MAG TPA: DUF177 domain-containing protein [Caldilineae bacterium]|nr:DUF177 domain-containing protein [Caldilineae bacterium]
MSTELIHLQDLQYNVAGLLKGPVGNTRSYDFRIPVSQLDQLDESFDVTGPFIGVVRFLKSSETVLVQLHGEVTIGQACSRCLEPFDSIVEVEFEEEFHPSVDIASGRVLQDTGDDAALVIDLHHILDLTELVRQAIIIALPITPLCREDCAGLCLICGANLNTEQCDCQEVDIDPRWEALSALIQIE